MDAASEGAKSVPGSLTIGILPDGKARVVSVCRRGDCYGPGPGAQQRERHVQRRHRGLRARRHWNGLRSCTALKAKKTVILLGADKAGVGLFKNLAPHLVHAAASPEEAVRLIGDLL